MWELNHKEGWAPTNGYFLIVVLKNTLESSLDSKEIKPVYPKGTQPWIFIGRTDADTKAPILWPPDVKSWHIGKDSDAVKDWKQKEKWDTGDAPSWAAGKWRCKKYRREPWRLASCPWSVEGKRSEWWFNTVVQPSGSGGSYTGCESWLRCFLSGRLGKSHSFFKLLFPGCWKGDGVSKAKVTGW